MEQTTDSVPLVPNGLENRWWSPTKLATAVQAGTISPIDCIVCSPVYRAIQSAKPFREAFPDTPFIVVDFSRELPARNWGAVDSSKLKGFTRLRGAECNDSDDDAQFLEMNDKLVQDTWCMTAEHQMRRNIVDEAVTTGCDDFMVKLGLGISDRRRKTEDAESTAQATGLACILQIGHSGMYQCSHNMKTPGQIPAHSDVFGYGEQRAYFTKVTQSLFTQGHNDAGWTCGSWSYRMIADGLYSKERASGPRSRKEMKTWFQANSAETGTKQGFRTDCAKASKVHHMSDTVRAAWNKLRSTGHSHGSSTDRQVD